MAKVYYRPIGLSHGEAALRAMSAGRAGRLGGHAAIAFHCIEFIERRGGDTYRDIIPFGDMAKTDAIARIIEKRRFPGSKSGNFPSVMGIVNVTPDSFSDGGRNFNSDDAIASASTMVEEGAAILDVGGESTRPGSEAISAEEEVSRILPVIKALSHRGYCVSCDTRKSEVMKEAARAGTTIINDVSALQHDPRSAETVAELGLPVVLMHAQGDPRTMQLNPTYEDVVLDVYDHLEARIAAAREAGIEHVAADPGIGFGKTFHHNLEILSQLTLYHGLGVPLVMGLSRKAFIGAITGEKVAGNRVNGSVGGAVHAALHGAHVLRVHDVKATIEALAVALVAANPAIIGL